MDRKSAERKFLVVSSVIVALLGVKTFFSLVEEPMYVEKARKPAAVTAKVQSPKPVDLAEAANQWVNLNFNCKKEDKKEYAVRGAFLQIRGKGCGREHQGQISIINKSNGYTASVFSASGEDFQTDLIQLVEGQNDILIQYSNSQGKKFERQVVVKSSHI
jgi:hypothetical protein